MKLYNDIVQFDTDTRIMSNGNAQGIGYTLDAYKDSVINVQGDYIDLDLTRLSYLNFDIKEGIGENKETPNRITKIIDFAEGEISALDLLKMVSEQATDPEKAGE